jgi:TRAP-type C4-dicarboxylate transport system substrate-binding protein
MKHTACIISLVLNMLMSVPTGTAEPITWDLINEYPASTLPGEADTFFAEAVQRKTNGQLTVRPMPDAKSGLRSRDQLRAVTEGRFAMANSVGGTLGNDEAIFLLSSLPFIVSSNEQARALSQAARPLYEKAFAERNQRLLYVSPWPPSGIWSTMPIAGAGTLAALRIRTYDQVGTDVFARVAAAASVVSFSELTPKLESGEINAVLSSGDGGAGRQFWKYLQHFSAITYAIPLSFAAVSLPAWSQLDERMRNAVDEAARETTDRQWSRLPERLAANYGVMREYKVAIDEHPPPDVVLALTVAGMKPLMEWQMRAGPQAARVLEEFKARGGR